MKRHMVDKVTTTPCLCFNCGRRIPAGTLYRGKSGDPKVVCPPGQCFPRPLKGTAA